MNESPLVSVALATFNGEKYLAQQLDSLLAQDYPNLEIVISDDGSTDSTSQILARYAKLDQRIRLLPRSGNLGAILNFSRCFAACHGDLISPCDQDDIWYPRKTSRLVEAMGDALLIYCNSRLIDGENRPTGCMLADTLYMIHGNDPRAFIFSNSVLGHAMVFRKCILDAHGAITAGVPHDWWLAFVAANLGHITYLDEVLVDYRRHEASITQAAANSRSKSQRLRHMNEDTLRLKAMAEFPSPHQAYVKRIRDAWLAWHQSYLSLSMLRVVLCHGAITHQALLKKKTTLHLSMKYLAGHRLKRFLRPDYYPD
jgi:glycosyltransferase involved in cell wall biosynthesis